MTKETGLIFLLLFLAYTLWNTIPNIVFYFEQVEAIAEIKSIRKGKLEFSYFNEGKKKEYILYAKIPYIKDQKALKEAKTWNILYSKTFPRMVTLININPLPGLILHLIWIVFATIPLVYFKNIDWKKK